MKQNFHEERFFIIHGPEHAGKFTCAAHLGMELCGNEQNFSGKIHIYKWTTRDSLKLTDFVQHEKLKEHTICIIEDAFDQATGGIRGSISAGIPSFSFRTYFITLAMAMAPDQFSPAIMTLLRLASSWQGNISPMINIKAASRISFIFILFFHFSRAFYCLNLSRTG